MGTRTLLRVGEKLVFVDDRGNGHLGRGGSTFDSNHAALAADADAFGERDLGRQSQGEVNGGASLDGGIDVEADSTGANVASLRVVLRIVLAVTDAHGQAERESASGSLVCILVVVEVVVVVFVVIVLFFVASLLGFCHRASHKLPVSMASTGKPVKAEGARIGDGTRRSNSYNRRVVFVLDNYDSFTYNLVQYIGELGAEVEVRRNNEVTIGEIEAMNPERIVVSPGPCTPQEAGISIELIRHFADESKRNRKNNVPVLGVCLGHQAIGAAFGGQVVRAKNLMHGKTSPVEHDGKTIFRGLSSPMTATRYHSLIVAEKDLPSDLEVSAWTHDGDGTRVIMGLRHRKFPVEGVQFHPESVLTEEGKKLVANFLQLKSL